MPKKIEYTPLIPCEICKSVVYENDVKDHEAYHEDEKDRIDRRIDSNLIAIKLILEAVVVPGIANLNQELVALKQEMSEFKKDISEFKTYVYSKLGN